MTAEVTEPTLFDEEPAPPDNTQALEALPPRTEDERLEPVPTELKLKSGLEFELEALRLRQFLALLRILTRGAAGAMASGALSNSRDTNAFIRELMSMLLFSIPEAEEETIDFIKSMTYAKREPIDSDDAYEEKKQLFSAELDNPDLLDTITIFQALLEREGDDLRGLGNRLRAMMQVATKMGANKPKK